MCIRDRIVALQIYEAVDVAIPSADTIIQVDSDNTIMGIPPPSGVKKRTNSSRIPFEHHKSRL